MKKYFLLFAAGGLLTLASCGGDSTPTETMNVDSIAAVKADSIAAALKAESDAAIAMAAQATADSMAQVMREDSIIAATKAAAGKGAKPVTKKTTTKPQGNTGTAVVPSEPPKQETIGNGKPKLNEQKSDNTIGNGKPKLR